MYNRAWPLLVPALCLAWLSATATSVAARDFAASRPFTSRPWATSRPFERRGDIFERLKRELDLTADQVERVKQILETHRQTLRNWSSENEQKLQDLHTQLDQARKADDKDKVRSLRQQLDKLTQGRRDLWANMEKQLADVLTPEQMAKARVILHRLAGLAKAQLDLSRLGRHLELTTDQRVQVKAILDKAATDAQAAKTDADKEAIWKTAREKIRADVLTDAQRAKLAHQEAAGGFFDVVKNLKLTDDQKQKIDAIRADTQTQLKKASSEVQKREIVAAGFKKIYDDVLTDAQRAGLKAESEHWRHRGGPHSPESAPASRPAE